jgi:hypothetical protein
MDPSMAVWGAYGLASLGCFAYWQVQDLKKKLEERVTALESQVASLKAAQVSTSG